MTRIYLAYRDIDDYQPRRSFEILAPPPGSLMVKDQTIPGEFGHKPIYIQWSHYTVRAKPVSLVTYTHQQLTTEEMEDVRSQMSQFLRQNGLLEHEPQNDDDQTEWLQSFDTL